MTDEQFKAFLNTMMDGFTRTIEAVSTRSSDHDLLIEIKTILANSIERQDVNHKEFLLHKNESVSIRDSVRLNEEQINKCKLENRGVLLKEHDGFIRNARRGLWILYTTVVGLFAKIVFFNK